jgi:hypothetical protein
VLSVRALAVYDGGLIAGGCFAKAGDVPANGIARWNGTAWQPMGAGLNCVSALAVYNGELIAASGSVVRWNGATWEPLGTGLGGGVYALTVYNGELVVAGWFSSGSGAPGDRIARWNGLEWQPMGTGMNQPVEALAVYNGQLIAGGEFLTAGGNVSAYWARWNGCLPGVPFDFDHDGDVDSGDLGVFVACSTGPAVNAPPPGCPTAAFAAADHDGDGDVDLADFGLFQRCYSGSNRLADPHCAD